MTNKELIIFLSGTGLGAAAGVLSTMQYFKKKYEAFAVDRIVEIEDYYESKYIREDSAEINPVDDSNTGRENGVLTDEKRNEIKKKLIDNFDRTSSNATNYNRISTDKFKDNREYNEEADVEDDDAQDEDEFTYEEHKKNSYRPPRIISADEYSNLPPHVDTQTLYFYHYDMAVTDDDENQIDDYERLIGDALTKYDFVNSDETIIFVMNYQFDTAYEIQRVMAAYNDGETTIIKRRLDEDGNESI